jgi:hypothetical protein
MRDAPARLRGRERALAATLTVLGAGSILPRAGYGCARLRAARRGAAGR